MEGHVPQGGEQIGETDWKIFLCVISKPASLQRVGLHKLWHPEASSPRCTRTATRSSLCCSTCCQAGHKKIRLHRILCAVSGSQEYLGVIIDLLFSFQLVLHMHVSDKKKLAQKMQMYLQSVVSSCCCV